jgi:hypothetical protein
MSGVVLKDSLYALGGNAGRCLDFIQRLSLGSLTWELMQVRLPHADWDIPCFNLNNTLYFLVKKTLYSLEPQTLEVLPLKAFPKSIRSWFGPSYYSRGTLYCSNDEGAAERYEIGSLTS